MAPAARLRPDRRFRAPRRRSSLQRYLGAGEEPILVTRQHPFALLRSVRDTLGLLVPLLLATWGIAGTELLRGEPGAWLLRASFAVMFLLLLGLGWRLLEWEFERVVVTREKVIHIEGVLSRRIASTPLAKVSEFTVRQPFLGRVFDYGMLVVDVPGGRDQALHGLAYLPDPAGLYRMVSELGRRGRMEEGGGRVDDDGDDGTEDGAAAAPPAATTAPLPARDPWAPTLEGPHADHTIRIPVVRPPGGRGEPRG